MEGLNWQPLQLPFGYGLNQKMDDRAIEAPELTICKDGRFTELGGIQSRFSFAAASGGILGGGSLSTVRRAYANGDELVAFTQDSLYSWNVQQSKWVLRGTHLAVKVDETPRFVTTGDQVDCDRAELSNTIIYVWTDNGVAYAAAIDKTTGGVITGPTNVGSSRPRLVALSTKILLFSVVGGSGLCVRAIDPTDPATGFASAATVVLATANFGSYYDVARVASTDTAVGAARRATTTSYESFKVTAALAVTNSTKARTCDGPIAVSADPAGTNLQIVRANSTNIQGDLLLVSNLSDVYTAQAIGTITHTPVGQIAAAHRSVQNSGAYRCYAFWDGNESSTLGTTQDGTKYNWVDTGNTLGTQAVFAYNLGVASRAFDYNGSVYVNLVFAGVSEFTLSGPKVALQNTYFLYRDDVFLCAKTSPGRGGGFLASVGHLPGVALTSGSTTYSWCSTERRIVPSGIGKTYSDRGPRDVTYTFDSNEARRCVRLGRSLYIACGEGLLQYDGSSLVESGFHYYPYYFDGAITTGSILRGTYTWKSTYRYDNAVGERERSTTATTATETFTSTSGLQIASAQPLIATHKSNVAVEYWRTLKNPTDDAPFYLVTDIDPTNSSSTNGFITNSTSSATLGTWEDHLADSSAGDNEENPENGNVLENLSPPPASIVVATDTRLFLGGVSGDPDRIWYSKQRDTGEMAAFHDALVVDIPPHGGKITGLAAHPDGIVVFRERATYVLLGDGYDNTGGGQNYVARQASSSVGATTQESICVTERGAYFQSSSGWYLLDRSLQPQYIGGPISDYDSETPVAVHALESQNQIRIVTGSRVLVLDTVASDAVQRPVWCEWSLLSCVGAALWRGSYLLATASGIRTETLNTFATSDDTYGLDVEMLVKFSGLQGFARCRKIQILGEFRSACSIRARVAYNYAASAAQDKSWTPSGYSSGDPLKEQFGPSTQQATAYRVRITITPTLPSTGESVKLTGLGFEIGYKRGLTHNIASTRRH